MQIGINGYEEGKDKDNAPVICSPGPLGAAE